MKRHLGLSILAMTGFLLLAAAAEAKSSVRSGGEKSYQSSRGYSKGAYRGSYASCGRYGYGRYSRYGYGSYGFGRYGHRYRLGFGYSHGPGRYGYGPGYGHVHVYDRQGANLGGLELDVEPKKAEVYVNGQRVGKAGKFDGFPGYLWLPKGTYQVIFYKPGFETVVREMTAFPGLVSEFDIQMVPGEASPPSDYAPAQESAEGEVEGAAEQAPKNPGKPLKVSSLLD